MCGHDPQTLQRRAALLKVKAPIHPQSDVRPLCPSTASKYCELLQACSQHQATRSQCHTKR
jgi:hypothetical protein